MRLDRFIVFTFRAAITTAALASVCKIANAEDAASRLQKIASVNSLDLPGKTPFHLKMSFQLYDLVGKQTDTGILGVVGRTREVTHYDHCDIPEAK